MIDTKTVQALFNYNNGKLSHKERYGDSWQVKRFNKQFAGKEIGTIHKSTGYLVHSINGKQYGVHQLVWLYHNSTLPKSIDHFDQDKTNNSIKNLRASNHSHNGKNRRVGKNNTTGFIGVVYCKRRNKYKAQIKVDGKSISIGYFDCIEDAKRARLDAEIKYGFCINHGSKSTC